MVGMVLGMPGPTSAQFFNFGGYQQRPQPQRGGGGFGGGWYGNDTFAPYQRQAPEPRWYGRQTPVREDFSKAPPPEKRNTVPERHILVLGDAMADWLAYGLEGVYAEQPDMGVIRRHKTVSGLIRYQPKGDPADWAAAAKGILATEKPDAIVVMLGLDDRVAIREPVIDKSDNGSETRRMPRPSLTASLRARNPPRSPMAQPRRQADSELSPDDAADNNDAPPVAVPGKTARSPNGLYEFREERWVELYKKKIEEMIGVLKSKGVPVLWVGLPVVRGPKATADTLFLDSLYRDAAGRAGITYVDVWDGFVDEAGRYVQQGPDFEGQICRLRSYDDVYFTKAGALKLAHYAEREIQRLWLRVPRPSCCPPNRRRPTPMRCQISRRRGRWPGRSFPWWHPPSAPSNCSALRGRGRARPMRKPYGSSSKVSLCRHQPAALTILRGRDAKSDANRPRAIRRWLQASSLDANARAPAAPLTPKKPRR